MSRSRILRLLRIGFSVVCGIVCLLVIVLWVRSAHISDNAQSSLFGLQKVSLHSGHGALQVVAYYGDVGEFPDSIRSEPLIKPPAHVVMSPWAFGRSLDLGLPSGVQYFVAMPHWLPVLVAMTALVMDRPRIIRLLRIAFSAACGIVCLLLIALWVRSYWHEDTINGSFSNNAGFSCVAMGGRIILAFFLSIPGNVSWDWYVYNYPAGTTVAPYGRWFGFDFVSQRGISALHVITPYWFPTLLCGLLIVCGQSASFRR
jgi:hypothetical protein